jgi:hypothetical protein
MTRKEVLYMVVVIMAIGLIVYNLWPHPACVMNEGKVVYSPDVVRLIQTGNTYWSHHGLEHSSNQTTVIWVDVPQTDEQCLAHFQWP